MDSAQLFLTDIIEILSTNDSLKSIINVMASQLQLANEDIVRQSNLINNFGSVYTIIGVFFLLLGIFIPAWTYISSIKPSKDILNDFDSKVEKKFTEFISTKRVQEVDIALRDILSNTFQVQDSAIQFLSFTQHQSFTDEQILKIYEALMSGVIENRRRPPLQMILAKYEKSYISEYFLMHIKFADFTCGIAIQYFVTFGIEKFIYRIRDVITGLSESLKIQMYGYYILKTNEVSKKDALVFFEDDNLFSVLSQSQSKIVFERISSQPYIFNIRLTKFYKYAFPESMEY